MNTQTVVRTVSPNATRSHPWERWVDVDTPTNPSDPPRAFKKYFGLWVEVVGEFNHYALIRRLDGLSCIVETADLVEVR